MVNPALLAIDRPLADHSHVVVALLLKMSHAKCCAAEALCNATRAAGSQLHAGPLPWLMDLAHRCKQAAASTMMVVVEEVPEQLGGALEPLMVQRQEGDGLDEEELEAPTLQCQRSRRLFTSTSSQDAPQKHHRSC